MTWWKLLAFLRRDLGVARSYRFAWTIWLVDAILAIASFFFLGQLVDSGEGVALGRYDSYFPFALIGVGLFAYFFNALARLALVVRSAQLDGTLEALVVTRTPPLAFLGLSLTSTLVARTLIFGAYLVVGVVLFDISVAQANWLAVLLFWALGVLLFIGLGLASASFILVFKKGDPINWAMGTLTWLLSGTFYPVDVLPDWLRGLAELFPPTPLINGLRDSLLLGGGLGEHAGDLALLTAFALLGAGLGYSTFRWAWSRARRDGTLGHY